MTPEDSATPADTHARRALVLFNYDWDQVEFAKLAGAYPHDCAGFDLFSFPSNAQLVRFDMDRFVDALARKAVKRGWQAVVSNHEQFGALAAALLAERMGWPGTPVNAVLACQHKYYARQILQQVCPEANCGFGLMPTRYGEPVPETLPGGMRYPTFVKPVKAAFSVLARSVKSRSDLHQHTRFGAWELWVIKHLVEPFERIAQQRMPQMGSSHRLLLEEPITGNQYNIDGYVLNDEVRQIGLVDAVHYPGTQSFMRFDYPSQLDSTVQGRALSVAKLFLSAIGFNHGLFNMEFFHDPLTDKITVIEFNPRLASQFSDLYARVDGVNLHQYALELGFGRDPALLPRSAAVAGAASSFVYRSFTPGAAVSMPSASQRAALARAFPDAQLFCFPKTPSQVKRDFKWLGSYRYGILHLGAENAEALKHSCERASALLGWPAPYQLPQATVPTDAVPQHATAMPNLGASPSPLLWRTER